VGRRLLSFGLSIAIQVGALTAPFVHAHLGDQHEDHHRAGRVHTHLDGHAQEARPASGLPAMHAEGEDGQVLRVPLFVAAQNDASLLTALVETIFAVSSVPVSSMRTPPEVVRSHGPPPVDRTAPRAPPAPARLI
jgi:hypothetical protein